MLSDRYKHSTLAFQGAQGMFVDELIEMHPKRLPIPDITFIFDLPVEEAMKRMRGADRPVPEMFERDPAFVGKLRTNYRTMQRALPSEYIQIVDANRSIDVVQAEVRSLILPYLNRVA